jgi:hypothetical protein
LDWLRREGTASRPDSEEDSEEGSAGIAGAVPVVAPVVAPVAVMAVGSAGMEGNGNAGKPGSLGRTDDAVSLGSTALGSAVDTGSLAVVGCVAACGATVSRSDATVDPTLASVSRAGWTTAV